MGENGEVESDSENAIVHRELFEGTKPEVEEQAQIKIAEIVAELEGEDVTDVPALYDTIDHVIEHVFSDPPPIEAQMQLEFTYEGYRIVVFQDGRTTFMKVTE